MKIKIFLGITTIIVATLVILERIADKEYAITKRAELKKKTIDLIKQDKELEAI